jgi:FtsP/CotA-like multicopper oxidase with cupredoxin domain
MQPLVRKVAVRALVTVLALAGVVVLGWIGLMWWQSRLPGTYNVMDYGEVDLGGGTEIAHVKHSSHGAGVGVAELRGPQSESPDARFTLTAKQATIQLASGRPVEALTFDGRSPGPELRVRQGDLVEVTLVNDDIEPGVTIHWHGVDVPNAEDGVAGVTQDAVRPGERHVYRFQAEQAGTFWYHTHQASAKEVRRGLFGALVIEPVGGPDADVDRTVLAHTFDGVPTLDGNGGVQQLDLEPGTLVRLRLINTDNSPRRFALSGTPFRVAAIDGTDLNGPENLERVAVEVSGGGRADIAFRAPSSPASLTLVDTGAAITFNGRARNRAFAELPVFDPLAYGKPEKTPFDASSQFDRRFELEISRKPGFLDGRPGLQWAINGEIFPHVPTFQVEQGDLVELTITNDTDADHPMHLHGHHVLVLSRDGEPASGSPWWADTLNVQPGEQYRVAFRADNPGLWMDHCHNLRHAADGLTMHLVYAGMTTPFAIGGEHDNAPE